MCDKGKSLRRAFDTKGKIKDHVYGVNQMQ